MHEDSNNLMPQWRPRSSKYVEGVCHLVLVSAYLHS